MDELSISRFERLFRGNDRSHGAFNPGKKKPVETISIGPSKDDYIQHLTGVAGLGVVPIRDDGTCWFAAIDIDNHKDKERKDLDFADMCARIDQHSLPLIVTRSKSGGAHLYLFGSEPLRADLVRDVMGRWAKMLNIEGTDLIFPRQSMLAINQDGTRALGNWINLPYFDADNTERYAVDKGERINLDLFLTKAESMAITNDTLLSMYNIEHKDAPPCLQALMAKGFGAGERNNCAYQLTVYLKKRDPETAKESAHDLLRSLCAEPIPYREAETVIKSALKKDYQYKCNEEPFKSLCDKAACKKCKYGISQLEFENLERRALLPQFTDLAKIIRVEPVRWVLGFNNMTIMLTTEELMNYSFVRARAIEKTLVVPPMIKQNEWEGILAGLMKDVRLEEPPPDFDNEDTIRINIEEFVRRADLSRDGSDKRDRLGILRGVPVVQVVNDKKYVAFRGVDFVSFLKQKRVEIRAVDLWYRCAKNIGLEHARIRITPTRVMELWLYPVDGIYSEETPIHDFKAEF